MNSQNSGHTSHSLSCMYDITNTLILLTAEIIRNLYVFHYSHSPFHIKMFICLLVQCQRCCIWPVFPLNITYILIVLSELIMEPALYSLLLFWVLNLLSIFLSWSHLLNKLWWDVIGLMPNHQARGPLLVGCLWLVVQYIHSYPPQLQASRHHVMVTWAQLTWNWGSSTD